MMSPNGNYVYKCIKSSLQLGYIFGLIFGSDLDLVKLYNNRQIIFFYFTEVTLKTSMIRFENFIHINVTHE